MAEDNEAKDLVAYNLSSLQIQEVFRLLQMSNDYYLRGDYAKMIHTLKAVKLATIQSLTEDEREELKKLEKDMKFLLTKEYYFQEGRGAELEQVKRDRIEEAFSKLKGSLPEKAEEYKIALMDILERHGYLIKKLEDFKAMF